MVYDKKDIEKYSCKKPCSKKLGALKEVYSCPDCKKFKKRIQKDNKLNKA